MKKLIFGCMLMLCGILGGNAWLLAQAVRIEPGAWSSMTNMFPLIGFGRVDGYIVLFFYAVAIVGAVIAARAARSKE